MLKKALLFLMLLSFLLPPGCTPKEPYVPGTSQISVPDEIVTDPACYAGPPEKAANEAPSGANFGAFTAQDLNGKAYTEAAFSENTVTMINIWGTFCPPCLEEMPSLGALAREYADDGLAIFGIVIDAADAYGAPIPDMAALAQEIVQDSGAGYIHLLPSETLIDIKLGSVMAVPETTFVDSQGNLLGDVILGSRSKDEWAAIIEQKLQEAA